MDRLPSILFATAACFFIATLGTGCGAKREIEAELKDVQIQITQKRDLLRQSQAESNAVGDLGRFNHPKPEYRTELLDRVESLKRDGAVLTAQREAKAASLKTMEDELTAYQTKFPPN